jgi:hypothetical protein
MVRRLPVLKPALIDRVLILDRPVRQEWAKG